MGVVFTGSCWLCLFFIIRYTMTLATDAATAENTTPLTHADSNTTWMKLKTNKL